MKSFLVLLVAYLLFSFQTFAQCEPIEATDSVQYCASDIVNVSLKSGNMLYLGGKFQLIGRFTGHFGAVDTATGKGYQVSGLPKVNNHVNKIIPDGNGGWFIAGDFDKVSGQTRNLLAQIDANGVLTNFNLNIVGVSINNMCIYGNTLYIGGTFSSVLGQTRTRVAAIDLATGNLKPWNPIANSDVVALVGYGNKIYLGGFFNNIGGQSRNFIAAVDTFNGSLSTWNPNMSNYVLSLAAHNGKIYAGGNFSTIGGQSRNKLAAIDTLTALPTSWNPSPNDVVRRIIVNDTTISICGPFTYLDNTNRRSFAQFETATGNLNSINLPFNAGEAYDMVLNNNTLFLAGNFGINSISFTRFMLAKVNLTTLAVDQLNSWNFSLARTVGLNNNILFSGGTFRSMLNFKRNHAAAIDLTADTITNWSPDPVYFVTAMAKAPGKIFTAGTGMMNLYDSTTAAPITTFNPSISLSSAIYNMIWYNNVLYLCGDFSQINGTTRRNIAALNLNGTLTSWNPNPYYNRGIKQLLAYNGWIYACGYFDTLGGQFRKNLAALHPTSGLASSWNPQTNDSVLTMDIAGNDLIIGGRFYQVNGETRNFLAKVNANTGFLSSWNPNPNGFVRTIKAKDGISYVAGTFNMVNGQVRKGVASLDTSSNSPSAWSPLLTTYVPSVIPPLVYDFNFYNNKLYALGSFDSVNNNSSEQAIAIFNIRTSPLDISLTGNTPLCSGSTINLNASSSISGVTYQWLLNGVAYPNTTNTLSFTPSNNDTVTAVIIAPTGSCYIPATIAATNIMQVNPNLTPSISINSTQTSATIGTNINVSATVGSLATGYSIKWFVNNVLTATTSTANFSFNKHQGVDTVKAFVYRTGNGCYAVDSAISNTIYISELVGIETIEGNENISIHPNPAKHFFSIQGVAIGDEFEIFDLLGARKIAGDFKENSVQQIDVSTFVEGLYFVKIKNKNGVVKDIKKLMVLN